MPTSTFAAVRSYPASPPANRRCSLVLAEFLRKELDLDRPWKGVSVVDVADAVCDGVSDDVALGTDVDEAVGLGVWVGNGVTVTSRTMIVPTIEGNWADR